ncbi:ABC transporter permease [Celeribacter neptunius]|uniref:Putative spermidine/putrescine transport system permease protein n=1 Tax=Celeribacter neptunius TaxID=588602 RepID=A0A1I3TEP5_9RHOB|nr:ABC transporter permease [Celeribacter neptunius]SFJ67947.1 putative spermidine/putrescine transport system permease protein [Celeribacter neptunius]
MTEASVPADVGGFRSAGLRHYLAPALLCAPLLVFLLLAFFLPVATLLSRSVLDRDVQAALPGTVTALAEWDGAEMPPDDVFLALYTDLGQAGAADISRASSRLAQEVSGFRTVMSRTARALRRAPEVPAAEAREAILAVDDAWQAPEVWTAIRASSKPFTAQFLLRAIDLEITESGLTSVEPERAIYRGILLRSLTVSGVTAALAVLLGYPVAYFMATMRNARLREALFLLVLLPFWTSTLVNSFAWFAFLKQGGGFYAATGALGLDPGTLLFTRTAVYIGFVQLLMPVAILPMYSGMQNIPASYMRAARSLGASNVEAFIRVYFPHTLPLIAASGMLIFALSLGNYVLPLILGGTDDQMMASFIALFTTRTSNWSMAAALSFWLMLTTMVLFALYGIALTRGRKS